MNRKRWVDQRFSFPGAAQSILQTTHQDATTNKSYTYTKEEDREGEQEVVDLRSICEATY
jgi:hypothetical protein